MALTNEKKDYFIIINLRCNKSYNIKVIQRQSTSHKPSTIDVLSFNK